MNDPGPIEPGETRERLRLDNPDKVFIVLFKNILD
jgi:hypothetical protein